MPREVLQLHRVAGEDVQLRAAHERGHQPALALQARGTRYGLGASALCRPFSAAQEQRHAGAARKAVGVRRGGRHGGGAHVQHPRDSKPGHAARRDRVSRVLPAQIVLSVRGRGPRDVAQRPLQVLPAPQALHQHHQVVWQRRSDGQLEPNAQRVGHGCHQGPAELAEVWVSVHAREVGGHVRAQRSSAGRPLRPEVARDGLQPPHRPLQRDQHRGDGAEAGGD
mmetsp:Transcript_30372/g.55203  ORF Transcript_30372/g.55203 Transcript_30372/m.55203 type:complete len:224 (+) Transcript_30372:3099-3770(+)